MMNDDSNDDDDNNVRNSPSLSVGRATMAMRGKRTGVLLNPMQVKRNNNKVNNKQQGDDGGDDDDMQDVDEFFEAATRAPATQEPLAKRRDNYSNKKKKAKEYKKRLYKPRFSLPGIGEDQSDGLEGGSAVKTNKYLSKVLSGKGREKFSPGEVSRASTEPPTPGKKPPTPAGGTRRSPPTPGRRESSTPGRWEPSTPGRREPSTPGTREPSTPGTREPSTPGTREPSTPGTREPSTPEDDDAPESSSPVADELEEIVAASSAVSTPQINADDDHDADDGGEVEDADDYDDNIEATRISPDNANRKLFVEGTPKSTAAVSTTSEPLDDDDDDLIPPPPPDEPPESDAVDDHRDETTPRAASEDDNNSRIEINHDNDDDDDDDDDKEGTGFQVNASPGLSESDDDIDKAQTQRKKARRVKASDDEDDEQDRRVTKRRLRESDDDDDEDDKQDRRVKKRRVQESYDDDEDEESKRRARKRRARESIESRRNQKGKAVKKLKRNVVSPKTTTKFRKKARFVSPQGIQYADREFEAIPMDEYRHASPDDKNLRRSSRARCKPLAYWKSERIIYGPNDNPEVMGLMPVPVNVLQAQPTPYKKIQRKVKKVSKSSGKKNTDSGSEDDDDDDPGKTPFDSTMLRKKYNYNDEEHAILWDESLSDIRNMKVVSHSESLKMLDLPSPNKRKSGGKAGRAGKAFDVPSDGDYVGFVMGAIVLPPKGVKDAESVGPSLQTFTICECQPGAAEVAFAHPDEPEGSMDPQTAIRFLLNPHDTFRIPPGNTYRLENHSTSKDCYITWTIIKLRPPPSEEE